MSEAKYDPTLTVPEEVLKAAFVLGEWAARNNLEYWQAGPVCDRKFAIDADKMQRELDYERKPRHTT